MFLFRLSAILILTALQLLVFFEFIKYIKTLKIYKPFYRYYSAVPFIIFNIPFIFISLVFGNKFQPPEWFVYIGLIPFYIWQSATFLIALILLIGKIIKLPFKISVWLMKLYNPLKSKLEKLSRSKEIKLIDNSRRKFVRTVTFGVSAYAFAGGGYGVLKHDDYIIEHKNIKINNFPDELKGLTITLISDIHAGTYMNEKDMRIYAEAVNELNSDIICIPGDFVNFQKEEVFPLTRAFKNLKARYGIYGSLGNHDFFSDADYVSNVISNESPIKLLRNKFEEITVNGKSLFIAGVDDTRDSGISMNGKIISAVDSINSTAMSLNTSFKDLTKILLCHKPYSFDELAKREFDLILSGHTHGGQVVPFRMNNLHFSFAALVSKYIEGHHVIGNSNMYISRGIGSVGLPLRLNCPPEITRITLI